MNTGAEGGEEGAVAVVVVVLGGGWEGVPVVHVVSGEDAGMPEREDTYIQTLLPIRIFSRYNDDVSDT